MWHNAAKKTCVYCLHSLHQRIVTSKIYMAAPLHNAWFGNNFGSNLLICTAMTIILCQMSWGRLVGNSAIEKAKDIGRQRGCYVRDVAMVVDVGGSRINYGTGETGAASHAAARNDFYLSSAERLTVEQLAKLQGLDLQDKDLNVISERMLGKMIGNAFSVPVISAILRKVIRALQKQLTP